MLHGNMFNCVDNKCGVNKKALLGCFMMLHRSFGNSSHFVPLRHCSNTI